MNETNAAAVARPDSPDTSSETSYVEVPEDFATSAFGHALGAEQLSEMPASAVATLIEVGYAYAMRQAGTLSKKAKEGKSEAQVAEAAKVARDARFKAILEGTYGVRKAGVGAATPLAKAMHAIAVERVKAICAAKGIPMVKGDIRKAAIAKVLERDRADIEREANARMSAAAAAAKGLEDLFA